MDEQATPARPGRKALVELQDAVLTDIWARDYVATSDDGLISVTAGGDARLREAELHDASADAPRLSSSCTEVVAEVIASSRAATARAMADLPGLNPQLRALLLGDV